MRNYFALLALLMFAAPVFAWGPEGHRIVADVARAHLTSSARLQVRELLGDDDLAAIANWADEIKSERPETAGWHFVDIPISAGDFSEARDCYRPDVRHSTSKEDHHNCVVDRIEIFQRVLADRSAFREKRIEALKFLVHFVGDIHQPLHAIGEARGGNDIQVSEFGSPLCGNRPCNLHFAWDVGMLDHRKLREADYVTRLEKLTALQGLWRQAEGTPASWANESFQLAKKVWLNNGGAVDETYYRRNLQIVDDRLALAAVRLAKMLNQVLGESARQPANR
jgi:S1/P1 Nuclease